MKFPTLFLTFTPPCIPKWISFVLNGYLFPSTQNVWESCVKWIVRTWGVRNTKQGMCIQEEWGRCAETSFFFFFFCIQTQFFSIGCWALKWWLNSLFWGCYSSSSLWDWYFVLYMELHQRHFYLMFPQAGNREQQQNKRFPLAAGHSPGPALFFRSPGGQRVCKSGFLLEAERISSTTVKWRKQSFV